MADCPGPYVATSFENWFKCGDCNGDPGKDFWRVIISGKPKILCHECAVKRGLIW